MTGDNKLKGLGGWLIFVGIGVVLNPLRLLVSLALTYKPIFDNGVWDVLTTPGTEAYNPYFRSLLIGELVCNTVIIFASIYLIYLFFSKHYLFPKVYIGIVLAALFFIPLDTWIVTKVFPAEQMFDTDTTKEFMRALTTAVIWIPYMLISERVKVTFIEGKKIEQPLPNQ